MNHISNTIVICFGRFNPPTTGHELIIKTMIAKAKELHADHCMFLTHTEDADRNPLPWKEKVRYVKAIFPGVNVCTNPEITTLVEVLETLGNTHDIVYLVVGEDRANGFVWINNYLDDYRIKNFHIVVAGDRDPDSNDVSGISASGARNAVRNNDFSAFSEMIPATMSFALKQHMFKRLREKII